MEKILKYISQIIISITIICCLLTVCFSVYRIINSKQLVKTETIKTEIEVKEIKTVPILEKKVDIEKLNKSIYSMKNILLRIQKENHIK